MSDLTQLFIAQETTRRRRAELEAASAQLELAMIRERMAEITSQHEPLRTLTGVAEISSPEYLVRRDNLLRCATFVVYGRRP